MTNTFPDNQV